MSSDGGFGIFPDVPTSKFSIAVIGDIRVEVRARLSEHSFDAIPVGHLEFGPIDSVFSGTAINFAKQAVRWFDDVRVISRIGQDRFTDEISQYLSRLVTNSALSISAEMDNGRTIFLRDRDARRILVAGDSTPIHELSIADIGRAHGQISDSHAVFADGYLLLADQSRAAIVAAMKVANDHDTVFCLDLVPHDIEKYFELATIQPILERADMVVSQARSVAALLGLPCGYPYAEDGFADLMAALSKVSQRCSWYLRYGENDMEKVLVCKQGQELSRYRPDFNQGRTTAGLGDRLTAAEIYSYLCGRYASSQ